MAGAGTGTGGLPRYPKATDSLGKGRAAPGLRSRSALDSATAPPLPQSFAISEPQQCTEAQSSGITSIYLQPLQLPLNEVFHLGTQLITRASRNLDERAHEARPHHTAVILSNGET